MEIAQGLGSSIGQLEQAGDSVIGAGSRQQAMHAAAACKCLERVADTRMRVRKFSR
jgi:hypothetical protein